MKRLAALFPLLISAAHAQCVMCFRTAASQNLARQHVMNSGIFIMLAPPFIIFGGFLLLCWRRSKTYADTAPEDTTRYATDYSTRSALDDATRSAVDDNYALRR